MLEKKKVKFQLFCPGKKCSSDCKIIFHPQFYIVGCLGKHTLKYVRIQDGRKVKF